MCNEFEKLRKFWVLLVVDIIYFSCSYKLGNFGDIVYVNLKVLVNLKKR